MKTVLLLQHKPEAAVRTIFRLFRFRRLKSTNMKFILFLFFSACTAQTVGQNTSNTLSTDSLLGTYIIDLRPTPASESYLKEFKFTKIQGRQFDGEFYGYPFSGGLLNLDWGKIYFAFTTADQSGIYFHSGYIEGNNVFGITLNENRKLLLPWKGERKGITK
jgi:hypothetical protein